MDNEELLEKVIEVCKKEEPEMELLVW
jgi:hypothetical protein